MPYDSRLFLEGLYKPTEDKLIPAWKINAERQRKEIELANANANTRKADQDYQHNEALHPAIVAQGQNLAAGGALDNRAKTLGMPAKEYEANRAGIKGNFLEQMFPGVTKSFDASGNAMSREIPPAVLSNFSGKSLAELRQMKATAGPMAEDMGEFIDPIIKSRSDAEELGPALQEITAAANMPGGTREEARAKSAALVALKAKYPYLTNDNRFEKAIDDALPKNPDPVYNPMQTDMAGFAREKFEFDKGEKRKDRIAKFRKETESERTSATHMNDIQKSLEGIGIQGGIFGDASKADIPGYGVGEKMFRKFASSEAAVNLRANVAALMNAYRNGLFGASLTAGEQQAFEEFAGTGLVANQAAFFSGLKAINQALGQRLRPESDELAGDLESQGILYYKNLPQEKAKPPGKGQHPDAAKNARLQELRAKKAAGTLQGGSQ
jgi:hypothetical protein